VNHIVPAMNQQAIQKAVALEQYVGTLERVEIETCHVLHAGMYHRTIKVPAGVIAAGALIKIPTVLTIYGNGIVYAGDEAIPVEGFHVVAADAMQKRAYLATSPSLVTMSFATQAKTVEEAEDEFTDEADRLSSRRRGGADPTLITEIN
jgi:hypothetical protein